ncbi:hypothetical protein ABH940_001702 [Streptacidiphilus sp. BW17]|uniref:hypothetical protein n=1 Tax=Streptacidiphilus sp. BW17 TaxID=3156274 RepID=UPI0035120543
MHTTMPLREREAPGPLPRPYLTPACKVGADRWPDLHQQCRAPGYQHRSLGWTPVNCACTCHQPAESEAAA